jgi:hypothetical protein
MEFKYCYVINYAPETGNPVTGYTSGMFRGITNSVYNANHEKTPTEAEKIGEKLPGVRKNDTQSSN